MQHVNPFFAVQHSTYKRKFFALLCRPWRGRCMLCTHLPYSSCRSKTTMTLVFALWYQCSDTLVGRRERTRTCPMKRYDVLGGLMTEKRPDSGGLMTEKRPDSGGLMNSQHSYSWVINLCATKSYFKIF